MKNFIKALRCWVGLHNVPKNWAFQEHAAIWIKGGICPHCGGWKDAKPFEDVRKLGETVEEVIGALKNQGYIYMGTPYTESWQGPKSK